MPTSNTNWTFLNHHFENVFQPIWKTKNWSVYAYESLIRTDEKLELSMVFQEARQQDRLFELDILSIKNSIMQFQDYFCIGIQLFVNVFPSTILNPLFPTFLSNLIREFPFIKGKLVLELNETIYEESIWDPKLILERVELIKKHEIFIALDDVGKGVASLHKIIEYQPDYIKLDQYFSINIHQSKEKQEIVSLLVKFCSKKRRLIMEGIDRAADLAITKYLQVSFVQGFILGKPEKLNETIKI